MFLFVMLGFDNTNMMNFKTKEIKHSLDHNFFSCFLILNELRNL